MLSSPDVMKLARGDVRISPDELTIDELLELFEISTSPLRRLLDRKQGMHGFLPWKDNLRQATRISKALSEYNLEIEESFYPNKSEECDYSLRTKIYPLFSEIFRLPHYDLPDQEKWTLYEEFVVLRICVTSVGKFFLESYSGKILSIRGSNVLKLLEESHYEEIPQGLYTNRTLGGARFQMLLKIKPRFLFSVLMGIPQMLGHDMHLRKQRLEEIEQAYDETRMKTRLFF